MDCPETAFSLFLITVCAIWAVFSVFSLPVLYYFPDILTVNMFLVIICKAINSIGLMVYIGFCQNDSLFWGVLALCTYPLYHSFLLSVFIFISKGYLIVYPVISEPDSMAVAAVLASSYLIYSISLINSAAFSLGVISYLGVILFFVLRGCRKVIEKLWEKCEEAEQDLGVIEERIGKFKRFFRILGVFFVFECVVGFGSFLCWVLGVDYGEIGIFVIQVFVEGYRFGIVAMVCWVFNPCCHLDYEFQRVFSAVGDRVRVLELGDERRWYGVAVMPNGEWMLARGFGN